MRPAYEAPVLRLEGVWKTFSDAPVLAGLNLDVGPGEVVSLIGPSGCGKTTTLRIIAGLERPDRGTVQMHETDVTAAPPERRGIGFVFQDYALFPHLTVEENVSFGLRKLAKNERRKRVNELLELVGLTGLANQVPDKLSGGQQQRVALARALAPSPSLLLLDEPFSNLDPHLRRRVRHEVLQIVRASGAGVVWVTHDHDEGLIVADRVAVLIDGAVVQNGPPAQIWRNPSDPWVAQFVGSGDVLTGTVQSGSIRTALGPVAAVGLSEGAEARVLVRPEEVKIHPLGASGTIVRRHFSGSDNVYCVQLEGGELLHTRQPSSVEFPRGTPVKVKLATDELPIFRS